MPDQTTEHKKAALSPSFCAKAAGTAFALAAAVFICIYLAATLTGKGDTWQHALPRAGMSEEDATAALTRAKYLHEAEVRPQLIRAGFLDDADITPKERGWRQSHEAKSRQLTEALWTMRAFPELHAVFLEKLLDTSITPDARTTFFYAMGSFLSAAGDVVVNGRNAREFRFREFNNRYERIRKSFNWFAYYAHDPRLSIFYRDANGYPVPKSKTAPSAEEKKRYEKNLAFAGRVLPFIYAETLAGLEAHNAAKKAEADKLQKDGKTDTRQYARARNVDLGEYLDDIAEGTARAVASMAEKQDDPGFLPLVRELMASSEGTPSERLSAIPLLAKRPGLPVSEYLFWQKYNDDLGSISRCVGTNPSSYAYLIGCCDKLGVLTKNMLKEQGSFLLDGQEGPGVTMTRTETLMPKGTPAGSLYLLIDMPQALKKAPAYDLTRATPVFQGHLFRYLKNQPLVLPLNPQNTDDAALMAWYSAEGWKNGRTVLFSAVGSPAQVAAHWASVHLLWWPGSKKKADEEPDLAYMHPESGHFWLAVLPHLKGKAVSRFLGPVTALWFGRDSVDKNGWTEEKYEARPEVTPSLATRSAPLTSPVLDWATGAGKAKDGESPKKPYSEATATVVIGKEIQAATSDTFVHAYRIALAKHLMKKYPDEKTPPLAAFAFVNATMEMLNEWKITRGRDVTAAAGYLWQFRDTPEIEKRVRGILADETLRPYERLRKVRRVLGLPAVKNTSGDC